ncbi:MAG: DUF1249 domain-containing protein [Gammaproteobacteria bacterium]|nr:DUF1249 domain-containing protein [Gammaproteobacteria bacterium]MDH5728701.1 DUF1249 domain-containing protein [Gammaproteobacteria bacterium]
MLITTQQRKARVKNSTKLYEANYLLLQNLLPDFCNTDFAIATDDNSTMQLRVEVVERFKYTMTVSICLSPIGSHQSFSHAELKVRLYHDARMAEVIGFQGHSRFRPEYAYPNDKGYQVNEKWQINHMLADVIKFCHQFNLTFLNHMPSNW